MLDEALFVGSNALAIWFAARLAGHWLPDADRVTRFLGGVVAFVATTEACLFLLNFVDAVAPLPQFGLILALAAMEKLWPRDVAARPEPAAATAPPSWSRTTWVAMALLAGISIWWIGSLVGQGVGFAWDDLSYHAPVVAWWMKSHSLTGPAFNYQAYYPFNAELHALWFTLPSGLDAHGNLGSLSWMAMIVCAFFVITRALGQSLAIAALLLSGVLLSPKVQVALKWFVLNDHAMAGCILAMLALAWNPSAPGEAPRRAPGRAFLCGLAGGLALGIKPVIAPMIAVIGLAWIFTTRRLPKLEILKHAGVYSLGVVLLGSFWYARNWIVTGNPIFPAAIGPFEGPFDAAAQYSTSLVSIIAVRGDSLEFWLELISERMNWPLELGLLSLLGYVIGIAAVLRDRDPSRRTLRLLLLTVGLLYMFQFPFQPFSGTANRPDSGIVHVVRYLLMPFLIGLVLLPSAFRRWVKPQAPGQRAFSAGPRLTWSLTIGALCLLALSTEYKAAADRRGLFEREDFPIPWQMYAIDSLPAGSVIATISNDPSSHAMLYPLFGTRLQHNPVTLTRVGQRRPPLHKAWRRQPKSWWWEFYLRPTEEEFLRNIVRSNIDFLLVSKWPVTDPGGPWPPGREGLVLGLPPEACLYSGAFTEIWQLGGKPLGDASTE